MAGVIVPGRQLDLLAELSDLLDEGPLRLSGEQGHVHIRPGRHADALLCQSPQQRADPCVGIFHIVNGVLRVLPDGKAQVKLHLGVGLGVEIPTGGVHADLVQQIGEGNGLAGTLGHPHHLTVPQELDQLHQHDVQPLGAVEVQGVQRPLQAGHMAMVVSAPNVDDLVKAPDGELVAVIGNIRSEVGVKAVGPAQHVVFQVQLLDVRFLLAGLAEVFPEDVGGLEPQRPVLLVGPALLRQEVHRLGDIAAFMEGGLIEPVVVMDLITGQIALHWAGSQKGRTGPVSPDAPRQGRSKAPHRAGHNRPGPGPGCRRPDSRPPGKVPRPRPG